MQRCLTLRCRELYGDASEIVGDRSGLYGDISGIEGGLGYERDR